ncbi:galactokinase [Exiguobacterium sp. SH5S13]|uniref:galactokinase n=1 Tax=Exiguobacterium sp. SH5S13 TaxID=2510959 RepID=UPI00103EF8B9|nr:galactokinase [Exiguobacterium sp. SH5S13]TCI53427.1 galactokinase [Exiguobacterium sp. SH5S13]
MLAFDLAHLNEQFETVFLAGPERIFFAPGRINLIGEHTDYNGGHVFPCAITFGTYGLVRKREDGIIRVYSLNFEAVGVVTFPVTDGTYDAGHDWANYVKGVVALLRQDGHDVGGFDFFLAGNIPNGAGLSSSASLELVTALMINDVYGLGLERIDLVHLGQRVENDFIGVNSGIMDQFAIGMGKADHAILLDCDTLHHDYAPIKLDGYDILIMNTNKRRELADSKYNERRTECDTALGLLQERFDVASLGQLSVATFETVASELPETLRKRARHAISENERTKLAFTALQDEKLDVFGQLLNDSHASLRDDYEVTGVELDTLVQAAQDCDGVIGARMTGAGFGGCAIAIVDKTSTEAVIQTVSTVYETTIGYAPTFYIASVGDGARELVEEEVK